MDRASRATTERDDAKGIFPWNGTCTPPRRTWLTRVALVLFLAWTTETAAQAQGLTFVHRADTIRKPEDVAIVPGGGIAVVRCVDSPDNPPAVAHSDEILVLKTSGPQAGEATPINVHTLNASYHGLTLPTGASDLVAATGSRAVLIGQKYTKDEALSQIDFALKILKD